jgi:uncharacterized protein (TIGR00299 family) protein
VRRLFVDCPTGLAGDMLLAALFDLGVPRSVVERPLELLDLPRLLTIDVREARSGGLRGVRVSVSPTGAAAPVCPWGDLKRRIGGSALEPPLRERVLEVFALLAEVEGAVHGHAPEEVHFHEVGALDALVDVVGVCAALAHLACDAVICAPPPAGHGRVDTAHGPLPLPAPAVLELARRRAIPLAASGDLPAGELLTPTGLALMAVHADRFETGPAWRPVAVGVGLGHRRLDRPNLVRLWLEDTAAEPAAGRETVLLQQCQIDDASGEDLAHLQDTLRQAGALEVFCQPALMKKGRPGVLVSALVRPDQAAVSRRLFLDGSTTLGIRETLQQRWVLQRRSRTIETELGPVRFKETWRPGGCTAKPEHEDLAALSRASGRPLAAVRQLALAAYEACDAHGRSAGQEVRHD